MTYIIAGIAALVFIGIAALISNAIKFEGGANPSDPGKRKMWFWVMCIINAAATYCVLAFAMTPNKEEDQIAYDEWMAAVPIAAGVGFVLYIVLGFALSKMNKTGKLGNWF